MVEQVFKLTMSNDKTVEKVIQDENIHFTHVILNKDDGFPEHYSDANVYMTVLRGTLSLQLDEQENHEYGAGTVLKIPFETKLKIGNAHEEPLEMVVVKAPAPVSTE
ncbi:hypothetical protein GH808_13765 [Acetobacterium fimetarium]|uniref:Cupin type-2 domain-containing protein n=1 Tax=Acetobacterium fimetarium TaxID=52691 RepID=A0ABR6WYN2_9FIRM|nr:cupin domain-containing protein [Acetobacterium fimetarium]MBC3805480.1 hypothetical protein [Acetobacterium fimetarium]